MHRRHRLRSSADFARVMRSGERTAAPGLVLRYLAPGGSDVPRVGFAIGRALGKAVVRNRTRRRLREAVGPVLPAMRSCDLVFVARADAIEAPSHELARTVADAVSTAGLLRTDPPRELRGTMEVQNPSPDVTEGTSS
jgi:ribonuclease P protein component